MNTARAFFFAAIIPAIACDEAGQAPTGDTISAAAKMDPGAAGPAIPAIAVRVGPMDFTIEAPVCGPVEMNDDAICVRPAEDEPRCPVFTEQQVAQTPELGKLESACARFEREGPRSYDLVRVTHLAFSQVDPHEAIQHIRAGAFSSGEANGEPVFDGGTAFDDFRQAGQLLGMGAQAEISYDAGTGIIDGVSIQDARSGAWHVIDIEVTVHPMAGAD